MDGFSGYNQIKMYPKDEKHTSFQTPLGVFCYKVRLKDCGLNLSTCNEYNLLWSLMKDSGGLCQ